MSRVTAELPVQRLKRTSNCWICDVDQSVKVVGVL